MVQLLEQIIEHRLIVAITIVRVIGSSCIPTVGIVHRADVKEGEKWKQKEKRKKKMKWNETKNLALKKKPFDFFVFY